MASAENVNFFYTLLPAVGIIFAIAVGVILLYLHFRKNLYGQMVEQEELKTKYQNDLLRSSIEVQEEERKRIAQDMHDELGATLSIARMQLVQIEQQKNVQPELVNALHQVRITTEAALATMRRLSHELMPPQLESFGLIKTLESVSNQISMAKTISISVSAGDDQMRLIPSIELALYRICMEFINNTIKHSNAKQISIFIARTGDQTSLHYEDDGCEFRVQEIHQGLGLKSIEARVNIFESKSQIGRAHV